MFVNTTGIGRIVAPAPIEPAHVRAGDAVILSGDIGRHGVAVMAAREGLGFEIGNRERLRAARGAGSGAASRAASRSIACAT